MCMKKKLLITLLGFNVVSATTVSVIDFDVDQNGGTIFEGDGSVGSGYDFNSLQPYDEIFGAGSGVTFSAVSNGTGSQNLLTVYNSDGAGGLDDDLEAPFLGGNGDLSGGLRNALILQTGTDGTAANNIDLPNDEATGGIFTISSGAALTAFAFTYIDLDAGGPTAGSTLTVSDSISGEFVTIGFLDFEDGSGSDFEVANAEFGDNHVNVVDSITLANLQAVNPLITQFDTIVLNAAGSGALGDVTLTSIPEPSSMMLLGLSSVSLLFRRKR